MELDDFKEVYSRATETVALANENISDAINHRSNGSLSVLQKNIRCALYLYPTAIVLFNGIIIAVLGIETLLHNTIFWILTIAFFIEFLISLINHLTLNKLLRANGVISEKLLDGVNLLKLRYKWYLVLNTALFWIMPVFMETDLHFNLTGEFRGLGKINILIRIAWYVLIFSCLFVIKKESQRQQYDQYLNKLQSLLLQIQ